MACASGPIEACATKLQAKDDRLHASEASLDAERHDTLVKGIALGAGDAGVLWLAFAVVRAAAR